jgi:hypothetical protein
MYAVNVVISHLPISDRLTIADLAAALLCAMNSDRICASTAGQIAVVTAAEIGYCSQIALRPGGSSADRAAKPNEPERRRTRTNPRGGKKPNEPETRGNPGLFSAARHRSDVDLPRRSG